MCFSNNYKHLITASDSGIIYFWKLPDQLHKSLAKVKQDAIKLREEVGRIPSIIEEVDEDFHELANQTPGSEAKKLVLGKGQGPDSLATSVDKKDDEDVPEASFGHVEVSDRLKFQDRDNTEVRRGK